MSQPTQGRAMKPAEEVSYHLDSMEAQFQNALPPQIDPKRFVRVVKTAVQNAPALLECNRQTLYMACLKAAGDGLLPDGREAALVKYGDAVQYLPMVGGILKKIRNSGELASIACELIHQHDVFNYWINDDGAHIEHRPNLFTDRGDILGVYAIAKTKDGAVYVEAMSKAEVEKVRSSSKAKNAGPWTQWWDQMAKKTVIRRLSKRLPMSTDAEEILRADDADYEQPASGAPVQPVTAATMSASPPTPKKQSRMQRLVAPEPAKTEEAPAPPPEPPPLTDDEKLPFET